MKQINYKNSSFIIFITISILYAIGNFIWWYLNTPIIPRGINTPHFINIFENTVLYYDAPLMTWIMKWIFFVFGKEYFDLQIIILNYFFFLISLYFIYKIGLELKDKETGNIAMTLFALTPAVYGMSRQYGHQNWHVMIAMTVNIYCLIKLNYFNNRKWSILYGITVGLGLLIKDEFLAYFFTPWLYVAIRSLIEKNEISKKITNIFLTIVIGSLMAGCHYFRYDIIYKILHEPIIEVQPIFCFDSLRITTIGLWEELLSPPIFILFIIGIIWFIFKYNNKNKLILLLWILIPWLIITLMQHYKLPEYEVGFIPAIIFIIAIYISNIKKILIIIITGICIYQYVDFSYMKNVFLSDLNLKYKTYKIYYFNVNSERGLYFPNLISYRKDTELISLVKYIKNNFINESVFLCEFGYKTDDIICYLKINDIEKTFSYIKDIEFSDIIINIKQFSASKSKYVLRIYKNNRDVNLKALKKEIEKKNIKIKDSYILLDRFYLDANKDMPKNYVEILGKKELFEGKKDIIKIPYKLEEN